MLDATRQKEQQWKIPNVLGACSIMCCVLFSDYIRKVWGFLPAKMKLSHRLKRPQSSKRSPETKQINYMRYTGKHQMEMTMAHMSEPKIYPSFRLKYKFESNYTSHNTLIILF